MEMSLGDETQAFTSEPQQALELTSDSTKIVSLNHHRK